MRVIPFATPIRMGRPSVRRWLPLALVSLSAFVAGLPAKVTVTPLEDRVRVEVEGKLFTEYVFTKGGPRPYFYPVIAADGTRINREFPMANVAGEEQDHPHHRSLWFTHGLVNGIDFWTEQKDFGRIVHERLIESSSGETGVIRATHRWESAEGKLICRDEVLVRIRAVPGGRLLDHQITLYALPDTPLVFGDTKEGTVAVRVAQWMVLPHKVKGKDVPGTGQLVTSEGKAGAAVWGTRAPWADYFAAYRGKTYGVALFDHPSNPRFPTWWHARDYGLFAANPFGQHEFENKKDQPNLGDLRVPAGGSVTFRHGFFIHEGDPATAKVAERFQEFAQSKK